MTLGTITFKPSRARKPTAPRTCCPTHADRCRFGRPHVWASPWIDQLGDWHESDLCSTCDGVCEAETR